jgi:deoxyhypusine synthase
LLGDPGDRRIDLGRRLHGSLCRPREAQHGRRDRRTGATIVDMDFFEALGHKHYQALEIPDDDTLRSLYIDRIYDTYIDEEKLQETDHTIGDIANSLEPRPYSSREFIKEMGKWLMTNGKKENSLVKLAYEHDVPIFCPAFVDSSAASASSSTRSTG